MSLKISRRHGTAVWYIRGTVRGVSVDESTKVTDKEQAEAIRAKREWEIITRQIGGARVTATFLEAAVSYMENRWRGALSQTPHRSFQVDAAI